MEKLSKFSTFVQAFTKSAKSQLNYYENYIVKSGINKINSTAPITLRVLLFS